MQKLKSRWILKLIRNARNAVGGVFFSSQAIRDGKKAKFSFEGGQLVLRFKSGKVVRFDRE